MAEGVHTADEYLEGVIPLMGYLCGLLLSLPFPLYIMELVGGLAYDVYRERKHTHTMHTPRTEELGHKRWRSFCRRILHV